MSNNCGERDDDSISITWCIDDVRGESKYDLTNEECREVLRRVKRYHDCNIGINWDVLTHYTTAVAGEVNAPLKTVVVGEDGY